MPISGLPFPLPEGSEAAGSVAAGGAAGGAAAAGAGSSFPQRLLSNPLFSAGFGLIGVGAALAGLRQGARHGLYWARRSLIVSLEIPSRDKSYGWFMEWMGTVGSPQSRHASIETSFHQFENGEVATRVSFVPSPGVQYFRYGRHWIRCERQREKQAIDYSTGQLLESVTLTTVGRSRVVFERMMAEARQHALRNEQASTVLYKPLQGASWARFGFPRRRKPLESVILAGGQAERIVADVRDFLAAGEWYTDKGIAHRRGYLLHGPPGCGKSSFIQALAGELRLNVCIVDLGSRSVTDDTLPQLLNSAPQRSIILLEDFDAALPASSASPAAAAFSSSSSSSSSSVPSRASLGVGVGGGGGGGSGLLTLSGLSNALDGVAATEGGGRLVFMTTNRYDLLSRCATLIRPGRVDRTEYIGYADADQARRLYLKFFPRDFHRADRFAELVPSEAFSMAQLQGYLLGYKHDAQLALERLPSEFLPQQPPPPEQQGSAPQSSSSSAAAAATADRRGAPNLADSLRTAPAHTAAPRSLDGK